MKKIKIIAPSSYIPELTSVKKKTIERLFNSIKYNISFGKYIFDKYYFFAGEDSKRLSDLENAFTDHDIDVILALRGGTGCLHLLDKINYKTILKHPKPFFGFSDTTALQNAFYTKIKMPSFTGFLATDATVKIPPLTKNTLISCLKNEKQIFKVPFLSDGKASGTLLGGNLRMFTSLLGTPYFPDMTDKILILEDVAEPPYKIDNMLMQLRLAGVFDKIKGLILGDFSKLDTQKDQKTLLQLFQKYFSNAPYPVARFKKYSHEKGHVVIPFAGTVHLDSQKGIFALDKLKKIK